ncbi:EXOC1 [Acanthosepion pharaonis]|uniref:EXOC1 n=1 Tax=Acanthosepion pharaonis TaxID=158019 RepID=A0A812C3N4_ACAPH|nr:EXOC1 [Sepia pharaonis]
MFYWAMDHVLMGYVHFLPCSFSDVVMTAIKHTLQREVFLPAEERLVGLVHVTKAGKKKKNSFLCAAVTIDSPIQAHIYQLKKTDKGDSYKKKLSWLLRELKVVDGKDINKFHETAEFDLHFEKVYKWVASNITEKSSFISCLWRLSQRYRVQKAEFPNIPKSLLEEVSRPTGQSQIVPGTDDIAMVDEDYQALSSKEESDLDLLMSECQMAISNAEAFAEQLSKQLSVLDGENIHSIMGSEDQVLNLMRLLDRGIHQATEVEAKLNGYDAILKNVKDQMEVMKDKDTLINLRNTNHQKLLEELDNLVSKLDLDIKHTCALLDGDLQSQAGINECTAAAEALQKCLHTDIHPALQNMAAVEEQQKRFENFTNQFAKRLAHHLNCLFIQQGNEMGETLSRCANDLRLPQHRSSHSDLMPYADLMLWLKGANYESFLKLSKVYTESLSKLYNKEIQDFLECARQRLIGKGDKGKLNQKTSSSSSLTKVSERGRSASIQSVDSASISHHGSDIDLASRQLFDQILDKVLSELEPVCLAEQHFTVHFFHLADSQNTAQMEQSHQDGEDGELWQNKKPSNERQMNEEMRRMMTELFPNLETELENFIAFADKLDGCNSMYMLVRMSQHVINTQDTGSFLSMTFANCLVKIKRNFDRFIQNQITAIQESKISKKNKCGIISFVHHFEDFANQAEIIFKGSDRRADLDKAYCRLVHTISTEIVRVAKEHQKTPEHVVSMENFHRMHSILSQMKISCLESERKDFKQRYQDSLHAYTTMLLGRPLDKLHTFFEGVESRVAAGVKMEEVGYQLAFSKQELRKVIKEYPGKEVKKGLEHLYRKVEKQLCDEENLLQVVWHTMQDDFIRAYKHYDGLINNCYPGSMISLEFSMNDVLEYFSNIAQSH